MIIQFWKGADGRQWNLTDPVDPDAAAVWLVEGGVEGMGDPEEEDFVAETALLDGGTFSGYRMKPREVFWPVVIEGPDAESWQEVARAFGRSTRPGAYGVWTVIGPDYEARTLKCRPVLRPSVYNTDPSRDGHEVRGVHMVADEPYWRGQAGWVTVTTAADPVPFFSTTPDAVLNLTSASASGTATLVNPGDVPAFAVITVSGPASGFSLSRADGRVMVAGEVNVPAGGFLVVDTDPRRATAMLSPSGFGNSAATPYVNVTDAMTVLDAYPVPAGGGVQVPASISGAGSLRVAVTPLYYRAVS